MEANNRRQNKQVKIIVFKSTEKSPNHPKTVQNELLLFLGRRRLPNDLSCRCISPNDVWITQPDRKCLGVDGGLVDDPS